MKEEKKSGESKRATQARGQPLDKAAALRVNLNIDGAPITSRTHAHPSHSETSRLLTSSL
jgi:hypothetical protein